MNNKVVKMLMKSLVLCCVIASGSCHKRRDGKFLSFNFEDQDINVDLQFSIPFLSIPIKKTASSFGISELPTININPASLVLGGAVVFSTAVLLPLVMKHYISNSDYRYSRILDNTEFGADSVINFANKMLTDRSNFRSCTLRVACWTGQKQDGELTKAVQRFTNNKLLSPFINATAVEDAMMSGRSGRDCATYRPCPIQDHYLPILLNNLSVLSKTL